MVVIPQVQDLGPIGETKKELAERYVIRQRFWESLLERSKGRTKLFSNISPSQAGYIGTATGVRGVNFTYSARQHDAQVEVYIDREAESETENKAIFDRPFRSRKSIEKTFGHALEWQRLDDRRACRVRIVFANGGYRDDERWPEVQDALNAPPRPQAVPLTAIPLSPLSGSRFLEEDNEPRDYGQNPNTHEHNLLNQGCAA